VKARILEIDTQEHRRVQALLPWHVNGTLDQAEAARVEAHIDSCARCQADAALQRRLRALTDSPNTSHARNPQDDSTIDDSAPPLLGSQLDSKVDTKHDPRLDSSVDRGWAALRKQLDADPSDARATASPLHSLMSHINGWRLARWQPFLIGAQGALVLVLAAGLIVSTRQPEPFHALGAAPNATANALVVFKPDATESQIRAALRANDARLVGGPTVTDAYLLRVPAVDAKTLTRLRADRAVLRVESLEAEGAR
jgi:hypothetical protein